MDASGFSHSGSRYGSLNQDAFFSYMETTPHARLKGAWGVFDGHGMRGEVAAASAAAALRARFERCGKAGEGVEPGAVRQWFSEVQEEVLDTYKSGMCFVCLSGRFSGQVLQSGSPVFFLASIGSRL